MFNSKLKKESIENLERIIKLYEKKSGSIQDSAVKLHNARSRSLDIIENVEAYINTLANTPKEFEKSFEQVKVNIASFKVLQEISYDEKEMMKIAGGGTAFGVATGVATAAFAPTAAMAIATTFGTASTGAAISGLSGVAATNAALAWLGGGALAAGGGGVAGGSTLLALAGPIGWGIGAASLAAGGIFASSKNKKTAIKADKERTEIYKQIKILEASIAEINLLKNSTKSLATKLEQSLLSFMNDTVEVGSFTQFSQDERNQLRAIINNTESLSQLFMKEIGK